jgi:hypothetical protein
MAVVTETVADKVMAAIMVTGISGNHGNKQNSGQDNPGKSDKNFKSSKDVGNDVDARVSFDHARHLA